MAEISNVIVHILIFISLYFEIFLLVTFFENNEKIKSIKDYTRKNFPSVSVIVPCYNEESVIAKTILSILKLDYPKNKLDILIVNDGSIDNTAKVIEKFSKFNNIRIFHKENGGKYSALNFGLKHVRTEFVGCLDADSFVDSQALKKIMNYFDKKEVMAVTPAIKIYEPKNIIQLIQKTEYLLAILIRRVFSFLDSLLVTPGPFSIFRKEVFDKLGGYREAHNTEDFEIALRMQKNHYKIENAHTAIVYTIAPKTLKALYKQRLRWTYGFIKNIFDYKSLCFKKEYGNLGMFILPASIFFIFSAIYFTGIFLISILNKILDKVVEVQSIGFNFINAPNLDLFFINTKSVFFLIYILFFFTFILVILGKKISLEKKILSFDMIYYFFIYGLLAPFWLVAATINVTRSKKSNWIDEKNI